MKSLTFLLLFIAIAMIGCDDCNNCEPFTEEPFVVIRFYDMVDSTRQIIVIDSINGLSTEGLRHFQDTTYSYRFPLNMTEDQSSFDLVYRNSTAYETSLKNNITVNYSREYFRRSDNYLVVQCGLTNFLTNFPGATLICKEEENNNCISNDAKANIYF